MAWLKIDDGLFLHPKWLSTPIAARALWISALSYAGKFGNGGVIHTAVLPVLGGTPEDAEALVASGLWERDGENYRIHDFAVYNEASTPEARERISNARAEAGRQGGIASAEARRRYDQANTKQTHSKTQQNEAPGPGPEPGICITTALDDRRQTSTPRVHTQHRDDPPEPAPPRGRGVPNDAPKHVPLATMPHPDTPVSRVSRRHGRESAKNLVEAILHEADSDPQRQHWRDAIVAAESAANPARPDAWRLQVLRNWLAGDGTPPPPVPAGQSIAISAISPHPPPRRQRLTVVEERIAAGEAVIDRAIQAMQDQIDRERAIATIPILEVAHG